MDHFRARPLVDVLDDDEGLLELMATILEDEGYAVEGRRQWQGALKLVRQVRSDVVILDVVFGREPIGWHVLEALKAHPDTTAAAAGHAAPPAADTAPPGLGSGPARSPHPAIVATSWPTALDQQGTGSLP